MSLTKLTSKDKLRTPNIFGDASFRFEPTAHLPEYSSLVVPAGQDSTTALGGIQSVPVLLLNRVQKIRSFTLWFETSPGGTAGDTFSVVLSPVWEAADLFAADGDITHEWYTIPADAANMKIIDRTHSTTVVDHQTLMSVSTEFAPTTSTIITNGSEVSFSEPFHLPLVAPGISFNLIAGATDSITINKIGAWGSYWE